MLTAVLAVRSLTRNILRQDLATDRLCSALRTEMQAYAAYIPSYCPHEQTAHKQSKQGGKDMEQHRSQGNEGLQRDIETHAQLKAVEVCVVTIRSKRWTVQ
jgi:hypothetical protein